MHTRLVLLGRGAALAVCRLVAAPVSAADSCSGTSQADLNACAGAEYRATDTALNAIYAQPMKKIGPKAKDALRAAQKAWLPYRGATCFLESMGFEDGQAYAMEYNGCLKELTDERIKVLKGYLNCKPAEISCVGQMAE